MVRLRSKQQALHLRFLYLQYEVLTLDQMSHYTVEKMFPSPFFVKNDKALWEDCQLLSYHKFGAELADKLTDVV